MARIIVWGLLAVGTTACGGGGSLGTPVAVFPSKADIEGAMVGEARPRSTFKTVDLPSFQLEGKVPAPGSAYPTETEWDRLAAKNVGASGRGTLSSELRCAAIETARFYVQAGGFPDDGTRRYLAERCGATIPSLSIATLTGDVPDSVTDAVLAAQYEPSVRDALEKSAPDRVTELGLGVARGGGKVAVVVFAGRPVARLTGFSPLVSGESVTLEGSLSAGAAFALGLVNQGPAGVAACEPDRRVGLPRFRMTCPFAPGDQQTRIEIATRKPNRVLMEIEIQALVRRSEEAGLVYEPVTRGTDALAADAAAFQAALLAQLNEVRQSARAPALTIEPKQSSTNERVVPHLYEAAFSANDEVVDQLGLGVLAGWDVNGVIRDGGIYWGSVTSSRSPGRFLTYALESPLARFILLDPSMSRVAIGASAVEPAGAVALLTTYSFFTTKDHSVEENKIFEELAKRRQARNRSAPRRTPRGNAMSTALAEIASNSATTNAAFDKAINRVSQQERVSVSGWIAETSDVRQIPWPDALLDRDALDVEIGVTHYKAPGGAWGQYVILVVMREPGPRSTASGEKSSTRNW